MRTLILAALVLSASQSLSGQQSQIKPVLRVRSVLAANVDSIGAVLARELGTSAVIKDSVNHDVHLWVATTAAVQVEVTPFQGRVIDVQVRFRPPVRNRTIALALIDLQPATQRPSINPPGGPRWDKAFSGIDEVQGVYRPLHGPRILQLAVTPDKRLYDHWMDCLEPRLPGSVC
jgi:hypothetical protein